MMDLSVILPARNERGSIEATLRELYRVLSREGIRHELLVINDGSTDGMEGLLETLRQDIPTLIACDNPAPHGFGYAVRKGLTVYQGEAAAIYMADGSDDPEDLVRFYRALGDPRVDCVFGSRFMKNGRVVEYPPLKKILNRLGNWFIQGLFRLAYNDVTNAFKLYRRATLEGLKPYLSPHYNLTVELPLKAIIRGYHYVVLPNQWTNRRAGESKLRIKEMGSRYLFIVLYCFIEKWLTHGDYHSNANRALPQRSEA
jgi:dolichol-phosphate mannosyltransferase